MKRIRRDASRLGVTLSEAAAGALDHLGALLVERAVPLGLISPRDRERVYERHILDCLRAAAGFGPADRLAYDLGTGAGLPGLVLAAALPGCRFELVDSRRKAVAFVEYAAARLALANVVARHERVQDLPPGADVVTVRALAALPQAWELAHPLLRPRGRLMYFAGEGLSDPVAAARRLADPEPPDRAELLETVAMPSPLVMMWRRE